MSEKPFRDVRFGDRIATDLYINGETVLCKGTKVDELVVKQLKELGVEQINIDSSNAERYDLTDSDLLYKQREALFIESLTKVSDEFRLGYLLSDPDKKIRLKHLFLKITADKKILETLYDLREFDECSYIHSFDVFILGKLLGDRLNLPNMDTFAMGCLLHDIGKLDIQKNILMKKDKLTQEQFEEIQKHPTLGGNRLTELGYEELSFYAQNHHERLDGSGYPKGIKADDLPEDIRVLMVIDMYSALTLDRQYKKAMCPIKAFNILLSEQNKLQMEYVKSLMELLGIFPEGSTVYLSNSSLAKVISVNKAQPYLHCVQELRTGKSYWLPKNHSISVLHLMDTIGDSDER